MAVRRVVGGVAALVVAGAGVAVAVLALSDDGAPPPGAAAATTTRPAPGATTTRALEPAEPGTVAPETGEPGSTTTVPARAAPTGECGVEEGAIRASLDAGVAGARERADLVECRLAPVDPTWALARLAPRSGSTFEVSTVLLHAGGGAWSVVDAGNEDVGCGQAPQQVIVDLGLFCAGTGGGAR